MCFFIVTLILLLIQGSVDKQGKTLVIQDWVIPGVSYQVVTWPYPWLHGLVNSQTCTSSLKTNGQEFNKKSFCRSLSLYVSDGDKTRPYRAICDRLKPFVAE